MGSLGRDPSSFPNKVTPAAAAAKVAPLSLGVCPYGRRVSSRVILEPGKGKGSSEKEKSKALRGENYLDTVAFTALPERRTQFIFI
jgi:hypothetical protein